MEVNIEMISVLSNSIALFMLWLFVSAGLSKLMPSNRHYYQDVLKNYGIDLPELAAILVWLIGGLELLSGLLIVIPVTRVLGVMGCSLLLILYLLVMAIQLWQGKRDMDCGCAGPAGSVKVSPLLLIRNVMFLGLLVLCLPGQEVMINVSQNLNGWLLAIPMAIMLTLFSQSAEQLIANEQKLKLLKAVM